MDTSKHIFHVPGVDEGDQPVVLRQLRRGEVAKFLRRVAADPDRAGGVRHRAPLGAGAARAWPRAGVDPAALSDPTSNAARTTRSTRGSSASRLDQWGRSASR
jgi:hypothetical protein